MSPRIVACAVFALAALAGACAQAQSTCGNCGTIIAIEAVKSTQEITSLGALSPGTLAGDSFGSQPGRTTTQFAIGRGFTNDGMVVLGAAGGAAYARSSANAPQTRWEITVRMDDGSRRVLRQGYEPGFGEGDRVRVYGTQLELAAS